jgi:hypothetical protein
MTEGGYRKACDAEYEACHILREQGWYVTRCYGERSPPDLFAARKGEFLLLMVRRSRRPVPGAHAISILYGEELERLRGIGNPEVIRKECWVLSPPDGWKYYSVYPGGIRRVRHAGYDPDGEWGQSLSEDRARTGVPEVIRTVVLDAKPGATLTIVPVPGTNTAGTFALYSDPEATRTGVTDHILEKRGIMVPDAVREATRSLSPDPVLVTMGTIVPVPLLETTGTVSPDPGTKITGSSLPSAPQETPSRIAPQVNGHA